MSLILRLALGVVLLLAAGIDLGTGRVPNWLTLPLMAAGASYSLLALGSPWFLGAWAVIYSLWRLGAYGGGDAKLLMGLFALTPPPAYRELSLWLALSLALVGLVVGTRQYGGLMPFLVGTLNLVQGRVDRAALAASRRPFTWAFALGGLCYLCLA